MKSQKGSGARRQQAEKGEVEMGEVTALSLSPTDSLEIGSGARGRGWGQGRC